VDTNDPTHATSTISIKVHAKQALKSDPQVLTFGKLERDAVAQTKTIMITRGDGGPLAPEITTSKNAAFTATLRPIEPGEKYAVDVAIAPPWPGDWMRGQIIVKSGVPDAPPQEIQVSAQISPRLAAVPPRYDIPRDPPAEVELKVALQWSGSNPGKATNATASDPAMKVRISEENGKQFVNLAIPAGFEPRQGAAPVVTVETNDKDAPTLRIQTATAPSRVPTLRPMLSLGAPGGVGPPMPISPGSNTPPGGTPPGPVAPPAK
jgi:hypothetical protein